MVKHKSALWLLIVALLIMVPFLAACGGASAPTEEQPPSPPAAKEEPKAEEPPSSSTGIPLRPHPLEGREDCLMCHETGVVPDTFVAPGGEVIGDPPKMPDDHAGRTSGMCPACHLPAE